MGPTGAVPQAVGALSSQDCNSSFLSTLLSSVFLGKGSLVDQVLLFSVPIFYPAASSVRAPKSLLGLPSWEGSRINSWINSVHKGRFSSGSAILL